MRQHEYVKLPIADDYDYPALVLAAGEGHGPAVRIHQCVRCSTVRFQPEDDRPRYARSGMTMLVEPTCI